MEKWLLSRFLESKDQSKPNFAFQGTINWMRALSIIVESEHFGDEILKNAYSKVQRRDTNPKADTLVFENMLMAFHNLASLKSMESDITHKYDICRSAIVAWYYATYFAASGMIAASSGSRQETHASTAKAWQSDFVEKKLLVYPFDLNLISLVEKKVDADIKALRNGNSHDLKTYPEDLDQAKGALISYLSGTADYRKRKEEEKIKKFSAFKELKVDNFGTKKAKKINFKTKKAQEIRDFRLKKGYVNFLVQAFRYRGKANYRDSIFLSYGDNNEEKIGKFISDLYVVSEAFLKMACCYAAKRVEKGTWDCFIGDLEKYCRLSIDPSVMKM